MVDMRKFGFAAMSVIAVGAMTLTGCTSGAPGAANSANPAATTAAAGPGPDADLATTTFPIDLDRALTVADQAHRGGAVTKIEKSYDRAAGGWIWKVDSQQGAEQHEIKIDAESGRVLADERDQESANPRAVDPRKLTPQDAQTRALALQPGSVAKWALEYDDGVQRYAFDIRTSGSSTAGVLVDVATGAATKK